MVESPMDTVTVWAPEEMGIAAQGSLKMVDVWQEHQHPQNGVAVVLNKIISHVGILHASWIVDRCF